MFVLIMAGGKGSRLNLGEKPLVNVSGRPMISWVIDAFAGAGCEIMVVASQKTPLTKNWCRAHGIDIYPSEGAGYVEDFIACASELDLREPFFTSVADLPCLSSSLIRRIRQEYESSEKEACSVWVPASLVHEHGCICNYIENIDGTEACPAGINILSGDKITEEQDELRLVLNEASLVFNINTRDELKRVEHHLRLNPVNL